MNEIWANTRACQTCLTKESDDGCLCYRCSREEYALCDCIQRTYAKKLLIELWNIDKEMRCYCSEFTNDSEDRSFTKGHRLFDCSRKLLNEELYKMRKCE